MKGSWAFLLFYVRQINDRWRCDNTRVVTVTREKSPQLKIRNVRSRQRRRLMTYGGLEVSAATSVTLIWGGRTGTLKHTCCRSALVYLTLFFHSAGATTTDINKHFVFSESLMERSSFVCTVVSTRNQANSARADICCYDCVWRHRWSLFLPELLQTRLLARRLPLKPQTMETLKRPAVTCPRPPSPLRFLQSAAALYSQTLKHRLEAGAEKWWIRYVLHGIVNEHKLLND